MSKLITAKEAVAPTYSIVDGKVETNVSKLFRPPHISK